MKCSKIEEYINYIRAPYLRFGDRVSSQDLLKFIALFTMIIDHCGVYFFPEDIFLRSIGRSSHIIWLFFVGYNFKNLVKVVDQVLYCGILLVVVKYLFNFSFFPLNILFSIIFYRIFMKYYKLYIIESDSIVGYKAALLISICFGISYPMGMAFEYGSIGLLIALYGYNLKNNIGDLFIQTISLSFVLSIPHGNLFKDNYGDCLLRLVIINLTMYLIYNINHISLNIKGVMKHIINISSRYSLYLYCFHVILFIFIKRELL